MRLGHRYLGIKHRYHGKGKDIRLDTKYEVAFTIDI
jgi:hypothetical protein